MATTNGALTPPASAATPSDTAELKRKREEDDTTYTEAESRNAQLQRDILEILQQ
jgi:hypothetical protein